MHEYSLVQAMFERIGAVMQAHDAVAVHRVRVRIGDRAGVEPALFQTAYDVFRVGTACAGAALDIVAVDASDELTLDRLDLEVP
jgi:hydrogenase nickel incorporation protein HypA/HybF